MSVGFRSARLLSETDPAIDIGRIVFFDGMKARIDDLTDCDLFCYKTNFLPDWIFSRDIINFYFRIFSPDGTGNSPLQSFVFFAGSVISKQSEMRK